MNTDFAAKTDGITSSTFLSFQVDVFFKKNFHFIQNLIRKRIPSRFHCIADPEQIAIEAIMKAFRKMDHNLVASPTESAEVRSYCIIVAKHLSMNAVRNIRRKLKLCRVGYESERLGDGFDTCDLHSGSTAAVVHDEYQLLLTRLNSEQKQVIQLRFMGNSNREIADELNCSIRKIERIRGEIREVAIARQLCPPQKKCQCLPLKKP